MEWDHFVTQKLMLKDIKEDGLDAVEMFAIMEILWKEKMLFDCTLWLFLFNLIMIMIQFIWLIVIHILIQIFRDTWEKLKVIQGLNNIFKEKIFAKA